MIRNILFPIDFSAACAAMAPFVKRAASITSAKVTLLHVLEAAGSGFELYVRPPREVEEDLKIVAREKLNSFLESEFTGVDTHRLLVAGDPAAAIARVARDAGFDVIVMPTHAGVFRRMLLGSTTAKVLNDADAPVFTTQHAETIAPRHIEHREWVCAVGLQEDSPRVVRYATQAAETFRTNLTLVHAIASGEPGLPVELDLEQRVQSAARQAALQRIEELQRAVGSHAPVRIAVGPIKDALIEAARRLEADVLVIGRSPELGACGRLRDLTYAVVRDAPCPVLSV
ncbi:MAG TPA: universal stress protein [Terriglobia bacterium]|nr:universal stress protein [Terriglobia bacterium]